MAKTKISIREKRKYTFCLSIVFSCLAFILVFFEFTLLFHGGWDDVNYTAVFAAPLVSSIAMLLAIINIVKFRAKSHEIVFALSMVAVSALFFCCVMLFTSTAYIAGA